ncbi:DUF3472 domain-containing protein [Pedobacter psychroterrae]|uniref:DUF5077 domain-containing protein n=1 Tax=Pedobacter psychroterrae TaxID=2530453 RepID=A0A4R0NRI9_9SPHI|nr:DUF5077 domain-containing protein [Pedobacter psychroterrae]TCD03476.1 DUF5077 domain-containing protein [Pedobacter psychroterrae]
MNKPLYLLAICFLLSSISYAKKNSSVEPESITIPLGGNAWINNNSKTRINKNGVSNWSADSDVISIYFRTEAAGKAQLSLRLSVPEGKTKISLTAGGKTLEKEASNMAAAVVNIGEIDIRQAGYVKVELRGISKTGNVFAEVSDLIVGGTSLSAGTSYVKNNEGNYFHWGRRGPSVHLNYKIPKEAENVEWFYNELMVPEGEDKLGTYFMANGFSAGYFGMQVNSPTERRVLFSIWSPFNTDDPKAIPDSLKIILKKKGSTTRTGEFGNEGSGGQSYLFYPWKAGKSYAFLIRAQAEGEKRTTVYTAYFKDIEKGEWLLVASFERPQSGMYLTGLHSFLENFSPATGDQSRKGTYTNQWAVDNKGVWHEVTAATFTADATARINYRKDYAGGSEGTSFFLKNCGFFNDSTPIQTLLERKSSGRKHPEIDFKTLP